MFGVGPMELVLILVIVLIVFGVGKLPELGTGLGEGIRNFKKAYRDANALDVSPPPQQVPQQVSGTPPGVQTSEQPLSQPQPSKKE